MSLTRMIGSGCELQTAHEPHAAWLASAIALLDVGQEPHESDAVAGAMVGPKGGILMLTAGAAKGAQILIPEGALTTPAMITMRAGEVPMDLPKGVQSASPVIVFGP